MGDGTEPVPKLTADAMKRFSRQIGECVTRDGLDRLTHLLWRTYDAPGNAVKLDQLKARIKAQRDIIARNSPR